MNYDRTWADIRKATREPWYITWTFRILGWLGAAAAILAMLAIVTILMLSIAESYNFRVVPEIAYHQYEDTGPSK